MDSIPRSNESPGIRLSLMKSLLTWSAARIRKKTSRLLFVLLVEPEIVFRFCLIVEYLQDLVVIEVQAAFVLIFFKCDLEQGRLIAFPACYDKESLTYHLFHLISLFTFIDCICKVDIPVAYRDRRDRIAHPDCISQLLLVD